MGPFIRTMIHIYNNLFCVFVSTTMPVARELVVVALLVTCGVQLTRATLNVEVFGNTVMRGTARCVLQLPNGLNQRECPSIRLQHCACR